MDYGGDRRENKIMKIKIIIVEDEPAIARALKVMISQISDAFVVEAIAYSGEEGLACIERFRPQLVFSDIRMPVMDGLEMIEKASETFDFPIKFVLLTGYAEFSYAKKALTLQVMEYLLKPLEFEALETLLHRAELEIGEKQTEEKKQFILECLNHTGQESGKNPFQNTELYLVFSYYGPVVNEIYRELTVGSDIVKRIDFGFLKKYEKEGRFNIIPIKGNYHNEIVYCIWGMELSEFHPKQFIMDCKSYLKFPETYVNFIISPLIKQEETISKVIRDSHMKLLQGLPFGYGGIFPEKDLKNFETIAVSRNVRFFNYPQNSVGITKEYIKGVVEELCVAWKKEKCTQLQLQTDIRYFLYAFLTMPGLSENIVLPDIQELLAVCDSYEDLENALMSELCSWFGVDWKEEQSSDSQEKLLYEVKTFLEKNYVQALSYRDFYQKFGYNEKYISALYKAKFGITPNKYIMQLRINMAKHLLKNYPDMLLKDIAVQIGYTDSLYFSRIFKSYVGISPKTYQKNNKLNKRET